MLDWLIVGRKIRFYEPARKSNEKLLLASSELLLKYSNDLFQCRIEETEFVQRILQ